MCETETDTVPNTKEALTKAIAFWRTAHKGRYALFNARECGNMVARLEKRLSALETT